MNADAHRRLDLFLADPANAAYIAEMVAQAPPPSDRQRAVLAELLRPVRRRTASGPADDRSGRRSQRAGVDA